MKKNSQVATSQPKRVCLKGPIDPDLTGRITRRLLEFHSHNPMRALANDLLKMGVDINLFKSFQGLRNESSFGIPEPLIIETYNMLSHLDKNLQINAEKLESMTPREIQSHCARAMLAASLATCDSAIPGAKPGSR